MKRLYRDNLFSYARKILDLSMADMGSLLGLSPTTWRNWEKASNRPTPVYAVLAARIVRLRPEDAQKARVLSSDLLARLRGEGVKAQDAVAELVSMLWAAKVASGGKS